MYRCILNVGLEVHLLTNEECSGRVINNEKLKEYGLRSKQLLKLDNENLDSLLAQLKQILEQFQ